ncbi:MAG: hypothetical protein JEY79_18000 [Pseudodesulfovibrio sp.]|nr:hypothetical protein [Pseudodesulfovibrio sp.]
MTFQEFKEAVAGFVDFYCCEYGGHCNIEFQDGEDQEDFYATVEIVYDPFSSEEWVVPIIVGEDGEAGIQKCLSESDTLRLDGEGLYTWLFFEAEKRLREATT